MGPGKTPDMAVAVVDTKMKQIKKRRSTNILKVALFMMRRGKSSTKACVHAEVTSKSLWKKLFGSTPILSLENKSATFATHPHPNKVAPIVPEVDQKPSHPMEPLVYNITPSLMNINEKAKEKAIVPKFDNTQRSPSYASSSCSSEETRYASAMNLRELDVCEENEEKNDNLERDDEDCQFDDSAGDSMIDVKAELFIAQFYEQMRLQNS